MHLLVDSARDKNFGVFGLMAVKKIDFFWVFIPKLLSLHV